MTKTALTGEQISPAMENKPSRCTSSLYDVDVSHGTNAVSKDRYFTSWSSDNNLTTNRVTPVSLSSPHLLLNRVHRAARESELANSLSNVYLGSSPSLVEHRQVPRDADMSREPEVRAPDGGWGWMVLLAYFVMNITLGYQYGNFSVIYTELVQHFDESRSTIGWVGSIFPAACFCSAVVLAPMVLRLGERFVTILGGIIATTGLALSALLVSVPYMCVVYGVLAGFGAGMALLGTIINLQKYFDKKRALVNGIGSVGVSLGQMIAGPIARVSVEAWGLQGNLLLAAGVLAQNVVAGALLRPLVSSRTKHITRDSNGPHETSPSSCVKSIVKTFNNLFSVSMFKNYKFVMMMLGLFLSTISIEAFFGHYVSRLVYYGISFQAAAQLQMVVAVGMMLGRISSGFLGNCLCVYRLLLQAIVTGMMGLAVFLFAFTKYISGFITMGAITGWLIGCSYALQATVLVDLLGLETFAKAQCFACFFIGSGFCISIPLAGFLMEATHSYNVPFLVCGSFGILAGVILFALALIHRTHRRPNPESIVYTST